MFSLSAIGVFFLSSLYYRRDQYDRKDTIVVDLACLSAFGAAFVPMRTDVRPGDVMNWVHFSFMTLLFLTLAYLCLVPFTRTPSGRVPTRRDSMRNRVYRVCGYGVIACVFLMGALPLLPPETHLAIQSFTPVFWLESLAFVAFGTASITRSGAILQDPRI